MSQESSEICLSCHKEIADSIKTVTCIECKFSYHFGECSDVPESTTRTKRATLNEKWICKTCRAGSNKSLTTEDKTCLEKKTANVTEQLSQIMSTLAILAPMKRQIDELMNMKETVNAIEKSMQMLSDKYDTILEKIQDQDREMSEVKKRVQKLETGMSKVEEIDDIKVELNKLEQYGRLSNLEIHGIPETPNENLLEKVAMIAEKIGVPRPDSRELEAVHRIPSKKGKTPPVIMRFVNRGDKEQWLKNKNKLREVNGETIYIQENLTAQNRSLFFQVRARAKAMKYKFVWCKEGVIYVRKVEGEKAIRIATEKDLLNIK